MTSSAHLLTSILKSIKPIDSKDSFSMSQCNQANKIKERNICGDINIRSNNPMKCYGTYTKVNNMKNDFHSPDVNEKVIKNIIRQDEFKKQDTTTTSNKKKGKNFLDMLPSEFRENTNIYRLVMNSMKGRNSLSIGCPPSGDNFSLIQPEIGVVIKNDQLNKAKDGGRNFREKFKRFSLNDYDKLIKTILPFQNRQKVQYSNNTNNISNSSSNTNMFMNNSHDLMLDAIFI